MVELLGKYQWHQEDGIFRELLNDKVRNTFYFESISAKCKDKTVIDVGAGSGLLSIVAARAGAKRVYAVEKDPNRFARPRPGSPLRSLLRQPPA